jgi:hypothetical protein
MKAAKKVSTHVYMITNCEPKMGINTQHAPKKKADEQKDSEAEQEEVEESEDEE